MSLYILIPNGTVENMQRTNTTFLHYSTLSCPCDENEDLDASADSHDPTTYNTIPDPALLSANTKNDKNRDRPPSRTSISSRQEDVRCAMCVYPYSHSVWRSLFWDVSCAKARQGKVGKIGKWGDGEMGNMMREERGWWCEVNHGIFAEEWDEGVGGGDVEATAMHIVLKYLGEPKAYSG